MTDDPDECECGTLLVYGVCPQCEPDVLAAVGKVIDEYEELDER